MKLTKKDKQLITSWGYPEEDLKQIEEATSKTKYELDNERISRSKEIEVLGRETYLNGICRSAFHWSAVRDNNNQHVYFDSSKLFQ